MHALAFAWDSGVSTEMVRNDNGGSQVNYIDGSTASLVMEEAVLADTETRKT